jgi:hypothetical protein
MTAYLAVDIESTDLNPQRLTALEVAWIIVNPNGTQRTPLRSRFTELTKAEHAVTPLQRGLGGNEWANSNHGNVYALRMAEDSGLFADWVACPSDQIIRDSHELQRLILDDLAEVVDPGVPNPDYRTFSTPDEPSPPKWLREPERVHLLGAGVAQFDQPVLRLLCPRVVPDFGHLGATHYRPVDVSGNQTGLLGSSMDAELIEWAVRTYGGDITQIDVDTPPRYAYPGNLDVTSAEKPHRAPADVARAIIVQRALWRYAAPLREALVSPR